MRGAVPPILQYVLMAWYLVKHRDDFTFTCFSDSNAVHQLLFFKNGLRPFQKYACTWNALDCL